MIPLLITFLTILYVVVAAAVWARRSPPPDPLETHKKLCGEEYQYAHTCPSHIPVTGFSKTCDECWTRSFEACLYGHCRAAVVRHLAKEIVVAIFWLPMVPVALGIKLGKLTMEFQREVFSE